jgi:hypothetical protein
MWFGVIDVDVGNYRFQSWTTHGQSCNKTQYDSFSKELLIIFLWLWTKLNGNEAIVGEIR